MSKLASIQKVHKIEPIPGSDFIELAHVLGWQCVVKKGEFKEGDLGVYICIDTVVPKTPIFEFLSKYNFRVKTQKLRGVLSQGLLLPLNSVFTERVSSLSKEGDDVTLELGVIKYEKPDNNPFLYQKNQIPKKGWRKYWYKFMFLIVYKLFPNLKPKERHSFPTHLVSITDEERIQNVPEVLERYKGKTFHLRYKLDGSSITIIHEKFLWKSKYRICSRRFELFGKKNDWYETFRTTGFKRHIDSLVDYYNTNNIIVQGECVGKFNGNHHKLNANQIRVFNVYVDGKRLLPVEFDIVTDSLNIPACQFKDYRALPETIDEILAISECKGPFNDEENEGFVWRCIDDGYSFKAVNNKYLLKKGE